MVGLALVAAMAVLVLFGDRLVDSPADETRLWLGAQPPGAAHPQAPAEARFEIGRPLPLRDSLRRARQLRYRLRDSRLRQVRIGLRRGVVDSLSEGAEQMATLDLASLPTAPHELLENGSIGRALPPVVVRPGEPPPAGLLAAGQRVLFVAWEEAGDERVVTIDAQAGQVVGIRLTVDGETTAVAAVTLRGAAVVELLADGRARRLRHPLGTDELGRDMLLRIVNGGRISLLVGAVATAVSLLVGVVYGAVAGYLGGRVDALMMRLVDLLYGLPFIFLVLLLMVVFDRNIVLLFAALGLVQWLTMARIVRGQILSLRQREYVEAARMSGASTVAIIFRHLLPHTIGPVIVYATLTVPVVIMEESFLAFIGLPVQYQGTTLDSWGSLVHLGMSALGEGGQKWWLLLFPSLAMVLTLFGLNCLGDGLRDCLDPKDGGR